MLTPEEIKSIANSGEGYNADFKFGIPSKVSEISHDVCAFANSEGGYVLMGIDNTGKIVGVNIDNNKRSVIQNAIHAVSPDVDVKVYAVEVENKTVWALAIPAGKDKPYVSSGAVYLRKGANTQKLITAEELRSFFQFSNRIYFDAVPCKKFDFEKDFDEEIFNQFKDEASISGRISNRQILNNLQCFDDETELIKNGGVLFFGKNPQQFFPQAIVRCVKFKGTTKVHIIDDKRYGGTLYQQYLQAQTWIMDKLEVQYIIKGMEARNEIWEIPLTVFKEALINALSHRDYYEQGAVTMVEFYDDRVEISNPGGLLMGVKKDFGKKSMTRNPLIFGLFTRINLVEQVASGIPRMKQEMLEAGLPEPIFSADGGFFTIELKRPFIDDPVKPWNRRSNDSINPDDTINDGINDTINSDDTINGGINDTINSDDTINGGINDPINPDDTINDGINDTINSDDTINYEEIIFKVIKKQGGLASPQIATMIGKSVITTKRYLAKLKSAGKIEFRGALKTGGYYVITAK